MPRPDPWLEQVLAVAPQVRSLPAGDGHLSALHWPHPGAPSLLLLHAAAGNAHWWRFIAPFLAETHDVVALDFSGHGTSAWRASYSLDGWADDILAVIRGMGLDRPLLIGHSLGGRAGLVATARAPEAVAGLILVDTAAYPPGEEVVVWKWPQTYRPPVFPDRETAISRFVLVPLQPTVNEPIRRFIAANSLRETPDGFTWQFDPAITTLGTEEALARELLPRVRGRVALIYGTESQIVPAYAVAYVLSQVGEAPAIGIPGAHHHVCADQPLAFVASVKALLASWRPA